MLLAHFFNLLVSFTSASLIYKYRRAFNNHAFRKVSSNFTDTKSLLVSSWPIERSVIVIPDLHGDFDLLTSLLDGLQLVDGKTGRWTGGRSYVIQLGDIADRGPDSPAIYELIWDLTRQAQLSGGMVWQLFGNHEMMNLLQQTHYISPKEVDVYYNKSSKVTNRLWNGRKGYLGSRIVHTAVTTFQLGDVVFVHGGLLPKYAAEKPSELQRRFVDGLLAFADGDKSRFKQLANFLQGPDSLVWTRVLSSHPESEACPLLNESLGFRNATRMVVGHTPTRSAGVELRCGGKYVMADTGGSRWMGGGHTAVKIHLEISKHKQNSEMSAKRVWEEVRLDQVANEKDRKISRRVILEEELCLRMFGNSTWKLCGDPFLTFEMDATTLSEEL